MKAKMSGDVKVKIEHFRRTMEKKLAPELEPQSEVPKSEVPKSEGKKCTKVKKCPKAKCPKVKCSICGNAVSVKYRPAHKWEQHGTWHSITSPTRRLPLPNLPHTPLIWKTRGQR